MNPGGVPARCQDSVCHGQNLTNFRPRLTGSVRPYVTRRSLGTPTKPSRLQQSLIDPRMGLPCLSYKCLHGSNDARGTWNLSHLMVILSSCLWILLACWFAPIFPRLESELGSSFSPCYSARCLRNGTVFFATLLLSLCTHNP